jgi:hypothetical protein
VSRQQQEPPRAHRLACKSRHRRLDLLAFGFVADESHFQGGSVYLYHYCLLIEQSEIGLI